MKKSTNKATATETNILNEGCNIADHEHETVCVSLNGEINTTKDR